VACIKVSSFSRVRLFIPLARFLTKQCRRKLLHGRSVHIPSPLEDDITYAISFGKLSGKYEEETVYGNILETIRFLFLRIGEIARRRKEMRNLIDPGASSHTLGSISSSINPLHQIRRGRPRNTCRKARKRRKYARMADKALLSLA
jgi:hypothetical protein